MDFVCRKDIGNTMPYAVGYTHLQMPSLRNEFIDFDFISHVIWDMKAMNGLTQTFNGHIIIMTRSYQWHYYHCKCVFSMKMIYFQLSFCEWMNCFSVTTIFFHVYDNSAGVACPKQSCKSVQI